MESNATKEYSSGFESGWTIYFEQSRGYVDDQECVNRSDEWEEEGEEDLSMVSDASSGPAQFSQDNHNNANCYMNEGMMFYSVLADEDGAMVRNKQQKRPRRSKNARLGEKFVDSNTDHMLDDTAGSRPDINNYSLMNNNDHQAASSMRKMMDFSRDHLSTSYFKVPIWPKAPVVALHLVLCIVTIMTKSTSTSSTSEFNSRSELFNWVPSCIPAAGNLKKMMLKKKLLM